MSRLRNAWGRFKGYGGCLRCGGTWDYTKSHETVYSLTSACFPLCDRCWAGLEPEDRLPYYHDLFRSWEQDLRPPGEWTRIESKVLKGG